MLRTANETGNSRGNTKGTTITANHKICSWAYYRQTFTNLPENLLDFRTLTTNNGVKSDNTMRNLCF